MELNDINDFVHNANEEQLKAFGFLGQWMIDMVPKYCTCASKCSQNCKIAQTLGGALMTAGQRLQRQ